MVFFRMPKDGAHDKIIHVKVWGEHGIARFNTEFLYKVAHFMGDFYNQVTHFIRDFACKGTHFHLNDKSYCMFFLHFMQLPVVLVLLRVSLLSSLP